MAFCTGLLLAGACFALLHSAAEAGEHKIPGYIHICKRNDKHLEQCILRSVEKLRPKLVKGIPELDVPGLEPLHLPEVVVSRGGNFRAVGTDVTVHGASQFKITNLKADIPKNTFVVGITIPYLRFNAQYDVNAQVLVLPIQGKGQLYANATDVNGEAILKGHRYRKNGESYLKFDTIDMKLKISNYNVHLENLFNGNKELGDAVNVALNENKREFMRMLRPNVEKVVSDVLLQIANKIVKNFSFEQLFPL